MPRRLFKKSSGLVKARIESSSGVLALIAPFIQKTSSNRSRSRKNAWVRASLGDFCRKWVAYRTNSLGCEFARRAAREGANPSRFLSLFGRAQWPCTVDSSFPSSSLHMATQHRRGFLPDLRYGYPRVSLRVSSCGLTQFAKLEEEGRRGTLRKRR